MVVESTICAGAIAYYVVVKMIRFALYVHAVTPELRARSLLVKRVAIIVQEVIATGKSNAKTKNESAI